MIFIKESLTPDSELTGNMYVKRINHLFITSFLPNYF